MAVKRKKMQRNKTLVQNRIFKKAQEESVDFCCEGELGLRRFFQQPDSCSKIAVPKAGTVPNGISEKRAWSGW